MPNDDGKPRILVCEDDDGSRRFLSRVLGRLGGVDTTINGREAVEAVRSASAAESCYDIITLDLNMPEMGGQEALEQIRQFETDAGTSPATILITTARDDTISVMAAFREQADGYLIKPIRRDDILDKLAEFGYRKAF